MKFKWFKFYFCYREIFEKIPGWNCKKLLLAIIDYAGSGKTEIKLRGRSLIAFNRIKAIFEQERLISQSFGRKGAMKRWNTAEIIPKRRNNRSSIRSNREAVQDE